MLRRRCWQLRRDKLVVVHVLALRCVELHVSLRAHRKRRISTSCASIPRSKVSARVPSWRPRFAVCQVWRSSRTALTRAAFTRGNYVPLYDPAARLPIANIFRLTAQGVPRFCVRLGCLRLRVLLSIDLCGRADVFSVKHAASSTVWNTLQDFVSVPRVWCANGATH